MGLRDFMGCVRMGLDGCMEWMRMWLDVVVSWPRNVTLDDPRVMTLVRVKVAQKSGKVDPP